LSLISSRISYTPHADTTPAAELNALVAIYKLVVDHANREGRIPDEGGPKDVKGRSENDFHANASIP
jgi:hypothetical protein